MKKLINILFLLIIPIFIGQQAFAVEESAVLSDKLTAQDVINSLRRGDFHINISGGQYSHGVEYKSIEVIGISQGLNNAIIFTKFKMIPEKREDKEQKGSSSLLRLNDGRWICPVNFIILNK